MKHWIPNAVTLAGAFSALLAIVWAPHQPYWACNALIAAALFDMVDGRIARMLDAQSEVGQQLDSLVDLISFGVAPAYLAYAWRLHQLDAVHGVPLGILPIFFFVACSALRLAIFNTRVHTTSDSFTGIPTPVAALLVVTSIMCWHELRLSPFNSSWFLITVLSCSAILMIAPVPFPSFKSFRNRMAKVAYFGAMAGGVLMLILRLPGGTVLFGFSTMYVVLGLSARGLASLTPR